MSKSTAKWRRQLLPSLVACLLLQLSLSPAAAEAPQPAAPVAPAVRDVLSTVDTIIGEPIRYPSGAPAKVTAVEITLQPGQQTGWHTHPVPLFGYILAGELTVDYGPKGRRTYRQGEALVDAMASAHNGRNTGSGPVRILAVYIGMEGVPGAVPASAPAREAP